MKFRVAAVAPVILAATAALTTAGVASASAPYPPSRPGGAVSLELGPPISPAYCSGGADNVCARVYMAAGAKFAFSVVVRAWAPGRTFNGHFRVQQTINGDLVVDNSSDSTNSAEGYGQLFIQANDPGRVTVTAWKKTGPQSYANISSTGFNGPVNGPGI